MYKEVKDEELEKIIGGTTLDVRKGDKHSSDFWSDIIHWIFHKP